MYIDQTLQTYLDDLASSDSTPGGGSAAAVSGAMAAALASMVCRLTLGKEKYADVQTEISALLQQAEEQRRRFQELMAEDISAYNTLSTCFKMARETEEQREKISYRNAMRCFISESEIGQVRATAGAR